MRTRGIVVASVLLAGCSGELGDGGAQTGPVGTGGPGGGTVGEPMVAPDGSTIITNGDGSMTVIAPDGTMTTTPADTTTTPADTTMTPTTTSPVAGATCTPGVPATSQLPRLTKAQYDNTIRDLVGLQTQPSTLLAPDSTGSVDQRAWDGYVAAAEALAPAIMADATARSQAIACTPEGDGAACASQFIADFGARAFRRPLTPEETARFEGIYTNRATLTATGTFDEAAELLLKVFLQSPSFITRAELAETAEGTSYALNGYEIASRLSYMIWGSMPDPDLFAAAADGSLATKAGILAQAQRMVATDKARPQAAAFHRDYLHMGGGTRWVELTRSPEMFPTFSDAVIPLMSQETEMFFDKAVFEKNATFQDLLSSTTGYVNSTTASIYGLDPSLYGEALTEAELGAARPGVFTRIGFLTSHSNYDRTSPILRGAFLQKQVLCTVIPPPPPGVEGTLLPTEGLATNRERVDAQTEPAECATCHHTVINPTGFAMESFDAIGAVQALDNGVAVNTVATVPMGAAAVPVTGPETLMAAIAASPEGQRCYAQKWVEFAYQRIPNSTDACTVNDLAAKLTTGGYTVLNLIADLSQSDSFRLRAVAAEEVSQ